ncbi:10899_t:CDS:2, partial [Cetraspora pellucida]
LYEFDEKSQNKKNEDMQIGIESSYKSGCISYSNVYEHQGSMSHDFEIIEGINEENLTS